MSKGSVLDVTKYHFLGVVAYAQHNFAKLRPLLYSENGRHWDGLTERGWFPHEDLVYSVDRELHYASNTYWTFRLTPNSKFEPGKDVYSAVHARPAVELLAAMAPLDAEASRALVTEAGLEIGPTNKAGVCVPEADGLWVLTPELARQTDGRWRPVAGQTLKHLKTLSGEAEALCGSATSDGRFFLPPILPAGGPLRDWTAPIQFIEGLATDLRRWAPYGVHRARFQAAAQALRELAPHVGTIGAGAAAEARAAIDRATSLALEGETLTSATADILALIVEQEPFKEEVARHRAALDAEWEAEALRAVAEVEGAARDKLLADQRRIEVEIQVHRERLNLLREEIIAQEASNQALIDRRTADVEDLEREIDTLVARAAAEPAKTLAEWLGVSGFVVSGTQSMDASDSEAPGLSEPAMPSAGPAPASAVSVPLIDASALGGALFMASPAAKKGEPWLPLIDAALRARELPILMGPMARDFAEAWLSVAGGPAPPVILPDPTVLSLGELTPAGARGVKAPLAQAFEMALREPDRAVIALLDDLDPAAAGFWLPELARCQRQPERHGFPSNLLFIAIIEAEAGEMNLSLARAGELFPILLEPGDERPGAGVRPEIALALPAGLVEPAALGSGWRDRAAAFERALRATHMAERVPDLTAQFRDFLRFAKAGGEKPTPSDTLDAQLTRAATLIVRSSTGA